MPSPDELRLVDMFTLFGDPLRMEVSERVQISEEQDGTYTLIFLVQAPDGSTRDVTRHMSAAALLDLCAVFKQLPHSP